MRLIPLLMCSLAALIVRSSAAPSSLAGRDIFIPRLLEPSANAVWTKGSIQTVVWDVTSPPDHISNPTGGLFMRNVASKVVGPEYFLDNNFDIMSGSHNITVPDIPSGSYQVILIGNNENLSATFSIVDPGVVPIYVPPLLEPAADAVWPKGSIQTVVWDVTSPPDHIPNPIGALYMVGLASTTLEFFLANNFDILDGRHNITVPDVPSSSYRIVLVGSAENQSPSFSIVDAESEAQ